MDFERLRNLHQLLEEGIISDAEFDAQKKLVLSDKSEGLRSHAQAEQGHSAMPLRIDSQVRTDGGLTTQSTGIVVSGSVCPNCHSGSYVNRYTIWHGLLAFSFFPVGLCAFLAPVKHCSECANEYGPGKALTTFAAWFYGVSAVVFALIFIVLMLS